MFKQNGKQCQFNTKSHRGLSENWTIVMIMLANSDVVYCKVAA